MSTTTDPNAATAPKTLKEATALLAERETALTAAEQKLGEVETAHAEALASVTSERDALKAQFDSAVEASAKTAQELASVRTEFEAEKSARAESDAARAKADETVARLEKLCGVHGLDPAQAVAAGTAEPSAQGGSRTELLSQYAALKEPGARAAFYAKHKAALLD